MARQQFVRRVRIPAPAEEVFRWHTRPGALERITPAWERVRVVRRDGGIADGDEIVVQTRIGPLPVRWKLQHRDYVEGSQFRDVQVSGPFTDWQHTHRIEPDGSEASYLEDRIEYTLPVSPISDVVAGRLVRRRLERLFAYRHRTTVDDLRTHSLYRSAARMQIAVSGSTGLIGSSLVPFLATGGHQVKRLVRGEVRDPQTEIAWNPAAGKLDPAALEGLDAVIHLAGENIASGRWTDKVKRRILESRTQGTRLLAETLAQLDRPPKTLISASAVGYYGDRGDEMLDETSRSGEGFLADVCRQWEAATEPASRAGIRVVHLRLGVVLSGAGGALAQMLLPFRMGVGGRLGSGQQYMSWITLDDAVGAAHHALMTETLSGPVNAVAPNPVTNREFTKTLGKVLSRPTVLPMPAPVVRLVFGEMGDELLLFSARVQPIRLLQTGYSFRFPELEAALRHTLGRT